jgi:cold shock CspA family protein
MQEGVIRKWIAARGFGFVQSDDGGDIFVHCKSIENLQGDEPDIGARVAFEIDVDPTGRRRAVKVRLI